MLPLPPSDHAWSVITEFAAGLKVVMDEDALAKLDIKVKIKCVAPFSEFSYWIFVFSFPALLRLERIIKILMLSTIPNLVRLLTNESPQIHVTIQSSTSSSRLMCFYPSEKHANTPVSARRT